MSEFSDERLVDFLLGLRTDPELEDAVRAEPDLRRRCQTLVVDLRSLDSEFAELLKDPVEEPLTRACLRILVAVNEGPAARRATTAAASLALRVGGVVEVLHVRVAETRAGGPLPPESRAQAKQVVDLALNDVRARGVTARGQLRCAPSGKVARNIVWEAEELDADLIVLGSAARSFLTALSRPRVASAVMKKARCPVLVVR
jgi:nucleotide-binding universal stress UspA family protein